MKKHLLLFLLFIAFGATGFSQKTILKVNLYTWIEYGDPEVYMEFNLNEKSSIDGALRLGMGSTPFSNRFEFNIDIRGAYRYYFLNKYFKTPIGFYLRPVVGFSSLPYSALNQLIGRQSNIQLGATGGFQYVINKKFAIDLFAGEAYFFSLNENYDSQFRPVYNIGIGYAF